MPQRSGSQVTSPGREYRFTDTGLEELLETLPVPVLVSVTGFVALVPAAMLPKLKDVGEAES